MYRKRHQKGRLAGQGKAGRAGWQGRVGKTDGQSGRQGRAGKAEQAGKAGGSQFEECQRAIVVRACVRVCLCAFFFTVYMCMCVCVCFGLHGMRPISKRYCVHSVQWQNV